MLEAGSASPTVVEVWCVGDDGLTMKLRESLENAFKSSSDFRLSSGNKPGTLIVTIPRNVGWKQSGIRTRVLYTVDFTSADNKYVGGTAGSCWDDALTKCVTKILKDTKIMGRKLHQTPPQ